MPKPQFMTQSLNISELKNALSHLINQVARQEIRVLIKKNGVPVAAIISATDLDRFTEFEREREERFAVVDRMRRAFADVPPEEIEREAERSVAAARERRKQVHERVARSA